MGSRTYLCYVVSSISDAEIYTVTNRSAIKAAEKHGYHEPGETVTIRTHSGQVLSKVKWDSDSNRYINADP